MFTIITLSGQRDKYNPFLFIDQMITILQKNRTHPLKRFSCKAILLPSTLFFAMLLTGCETLNSQSSNSTSSLDKEIELVSQNITSNATWQKQVQPLPFANTGWLSDFADLELNKFVDIALKNNPDLKASAAQVQASIASAQAVGANAWPVINLNLMPARSESIAADGNTVRTNSTTQSLSITYEADIWGRLNAQRKAEAFSAEVDKANYKAAELTLVANIARAWYNLNTNKLVLDISRKQLKSQHDTLEIVENAYKSGISSALDVYLNRTDINNQEASLLSDEETYEESVRTFQALLGRYPSDTLTFDAKLPDIDTVIPAGLPSELVGRRPDVLSSLRAFQAAQQNVAVAQKAKLPSFSLSASYGGSSEGLRLLDANDLLMNLAGNLLTPIFNGGELKKRAEQAEFIKNALLQNYASTLITAYNEVENGLSSEQKLRKRLTFFKESVFYSESAYELATEQYRAGIIDYSSLLEAQRRWFDAESNLLALKNTLIQNRINVYLALGGDFQWWY